MSPSSQRMPASPISSAYCAAGKSGICCVPAKRGSPESTRCSQVTWFRSWLLNTQKTSARMLLPVLLPVLLHGQELVHPVHLERAVADEGDDRPLRIRELRGDRVGHGVAHRRQRPRERGQVALACSFRCRANQFVDEPESARDDRVVRQPLRELPARRAAGSSGRRPASTRASTSSHQSRRSTRCPRATTAVLLALEQRHAAPAASPARRRRGATSTG